MRILVTGGTGFIGRHTVKTALAKGHQVSALHRPLSADKQHVLRKLRGWGAELHVGEIGDAESLLAAMRGIESVCHFASAFRERGVSDDYFIDVNVNGTRNAMEAAAQQGVRRFVYCSTAGIYGSAVPGVTNEAAAVNPQNIYERSKVAAEKVVRELAAQYGMEYSIVRPAVVYGPHDHRLLKMFKSAAKGRFPLIGPGEGRRHMVYVGDVARAAIRAAVLPQAAGQEMIIAGPHAAPLREILRVLARTVNRRQCGPRLPLRPMLALAGMTEDLCKRLDLKPPIYRRRMDFYLNDAAFDCSRAKLVLGWQPAVDLEEGFGRTLESYREVGWVQ